MHDVEARRYRNNRKNQFQVLLLKKHGSGSTQHRHCIIARKHQMSGADDMHWYDML